MAFDALVGGRVGSPHVESYPHLPDIGDKTLVAWVKPATLDQHGGGVLTLEYADTFDSIVLGERNEGVWMAGSEMWRRTQMDQSDVPVETCTTGFIQIAVTYEGDLVTLFRNGRRIQEYRMLNPPARFGNGSSLLVGLRQGALAGMPCAHFAGVVDEVRLYDRALTSAEVAQLRPGATAGPRPLARWTFEDGSCSDTEGTFPDGELQGGAIIRNNQLYLDGVGACMRTPAGRRWKSRYHYRPSTGNFADPIPFYWNGEYHVFYLQGDVGRVPWRHIVSHDLVNWRELPVALESDGPPDSPDGGHMFTGCVMEHRRTFHMFYTGHNPNNPRGIEFIRHATSWDLIHWRKDPNFELGPDGLYYANKRIRNFRDPYVFWNAAEGVWMMLVIATDANSPGGPDDGGRAVQGLLISTDLKHWTALPPIDGGLGEECPDLFEINGVWYLIGGGRYVSGPSPAGPFREPAHSVIDFPGVYAGKRMFDGRRHVWVGWAWDGPGQTDEAVKGMGVLSWGGFMCLARELTAGPDGELHCRPVREEVSRHRDVLSKPTSATPDRLRLKGDGMLECTAMVPEGGELTLHIREQSDGRSYRFVVRPAAGQILLATPQSEWMREHCRIDGTQPLRLRVFIDGSILECFVNDAYAITRRVYDLDGGMARIEGALPESIQQFRFKGQL